MPDTESIERAVRALETERARIRRQLLSTPVDEEAIRNRLDEETKRRDLVELRAEQHEGMPLSLLMALLSACPCCHFAGRIDLQDAEALDGNEVWIAYCIHCTAFVEAPSPQQAFNAWNRRDAVVG